jgi:UDP-N-acetylmuramate dehydrogenase
VSKLGILIDLLKFESVENLGNSSFSRVLLSANNFEPMRENCGMRIESSIETGVSLKPYNTFGLPAVAATLVRIATDADVRRVIGHPSLGRAPKFVLGGGSNIVLTRDMPQVVLKVEARGMRLVQELPNAWIVEAGAGESWHDFVAYTLLHGWPGLENMALIPGTVGASPVQNIGAYGVELKDRFDSLDAVDLVMGRTVTLRADLCDFGYRDSVFKRSLAGRCVILRVRFRLPKPWQPVLGYLDIERKMVELGVHHPSAQQVFDWICTIRRAKLPDPAVIGNAGSFFKNPVVTVEQCRDIIGRDPEIVHYPMPDGSIKLAAGWMIDACGWKGKTMGQAGVYDKQALVLVNKGAATGSEVMLLARAIQESVYGRFGIRLEIEPVVV